MEPENFQFNAELSSAAGGFHPETIGNPSLAAEPRDRQDPRGPVPAGFNERVLAYVIDAAPFVAAAYFTFSLLVGNGSMQYSFAAEIKWKVLWIVPYVIYETIFSSGGRATIGKYLLDIRVKAADGVTDLSGGKAFMRALGYFFSAAPLNLGYLLALVTSGKRALHDYLGGSRVISIKERSDRADGLILAVAWALMAMFTGSWKNRNFLTLSPGERLQVGLAHVTIAKIAKLEEIHRMTYGRYTEDMKRLAALTGNPAAVRREIMKTIEPNTLTLATDGRAYIISAKAKNWRKTEVSVSSMKSSR